MNRLASYAIAFTIVIAAAAATVMHGPLDAGASPIPAAPTRSIDVSTSQAACHAATTPVRDQGGATLSANAVASNRTIAAVAGSASILDALPPSANPIVASWRHDCASWDALTE